MSASLSNGTPSKGFDYDLVIIGAGVGGHGAALHAVEKVKMIISVDLILYFLLSLALVWGCELSYTWANSVAVKVSQCWNIFCYFCDYLILLSVKVMNFFFFRCGAKGKMASISNQLR